MNRTVLLLTCFLSFGFSTPVVANVLCVQEKLASLGFEPGPADGALGRRTAAAAALFATNAGISIEPLVETNSDAWCEAITTFSATPAAATISPLDLLTEPEGTLPADEQQKLWDAYKTAKECTVHEAFGKSTPIVVVAQTAEELSSVEWQSPFTLVRGSKQCLVEPGGLWPPNAIPVVRLDERYGERQKDADIAASWFRRLSTFLRYSSDPVAVQLIKQTLIDWAKADSLGKGIRVSWGKQPVDYQMMATILAVLSAAGEVGTEFSPQERVVVGQWLNNLVRQSASGTWKDRTDNKVYMRTYMALLWGLMVNDNQAVQDAINTYKLAIHDMRPDGSWPIDSQRGGMGLHYSSDSTSYLTLIATALKLKRNIDLFSYEVDGRSIHTAVERMVRAIKDPSINAEYAISCPDSGDRFGTIDDPNMSWTELDGGYLLTYAELFPDRSVSAEIPILLPEPAEAPGEKTGGLPSCQYALLGADVALEALLMPEPPPTVPEPRLVIRTFEDIANTSGKSSRVDSLLQSFLDDRRVGFNVEGGYDFERDSFSGLRFILNIGLDAQPQGKGCVVETRVWDDQHHAVLPFAIEGKKIALRDADCILSALPKAAAADADFLLDNFRDIAIGMVKDQAIDSLRHDGLKSFMYKVALGTVELGR